MSWCMILLECTTTAFELQGRILQKTGLQAAFIGVGYTLHYLFAVKGINFAFTVVLSTSAWT